MFNDQNSIKIDHHSGHRIPAEQIESATHRIQEKTGIGIERILADREIETFLQTIRLISKSVKIDQRLLEGGLLAIENALENEDIFLADYAKKMGGVLENGK